MRVVNLVVCWVEMMAEKTVEYWAVRKAVQKGRLLADPMAGRSADWMAERKVEWMAERMVVHWVGSWAEHLVDLKAAWKADM
jgi:hypothetical protein